MKGIVLHGGSGTRLRPLTHTGPKQLIPIANKPISQYALEDLRDSGITDIAIIVGDVYPEKVKEYYNNGSNLGIEISYIFQDKPLGIAHAVGLCQGFIEDSKFVVYLGDNLLKSGIKEFVEKFEKSSFDAMILLCQVDDPQRFGVAEFDDKGNLVNLIEKPKTPPSNYALTGIYFFSSTIFDMIKQLKPSDRGELEITEAIKMLLDQGYKIGYDFIDVWWKDTGTPEDILEANRLILEDLQSRIEGHCEDDSCIQGRASIGKGSVVSKDSLIKGPVIIGENCILESGVNIGPYTSVGNNVVLRGVDIENSIIMDQCIIDVHEKIVNSIIGPYTSIKSSVNMRPKGIKFILGERSKVEL